jgi:hypothetical protein
MIGPERRGSERATPQRPHRAADPGSRGQPARARQPAPLPAPGVGDGVVCKPSQEWTSGIVVVPGKATSAARPRPQPRPRPRRGRRLVGIAALLAIAAGVFFAQAGLGPDGLDGPALYGQAMAAARRAEAAATSVIEQAFPSAVADKAAPPEL